MGNVTFSYQWIADSTDIVDATGLTYTLSAADEGKAVTVQVSFTDDAGNDETLTSAATDPVEAAPASNTPVTGTPTISGTAQVGETLTADTSGISDADGLTNATFSYQWLSSLDAEIGGATSSTYTLQASDEGKAIQVQVSFTDDAGNDESLTSEATDPVAAATQPNSPATGAPTISGTAQVGETLTVDTSSIADTDGLENASFGYQWLAGDSDISGATGSTYTLADADEGKAIKVQVSFTDDAGNDEALTSAATATVGRPPLTATVHDKPSSHDGSAAFTFELRFSEDIEGLSYTTLQEHAFTVTRGSVSKVRRLEPGKNARWEITIQPSSDAGVTILLPNTTDCATQGAICTSDGRKLSNSLTVSVSGTGQ